MPQQTTGSPLCRYCLSRRWAGWSTPPRLKKYSRPLLFFTNSYQPRSLIICAILAMYSPSSSGIAFIWVQGRLAWSLLLRGAVIASPRSPSRRGGFWNIIGVGWCGTGSNILALLPPRHLPTPSSLEGAAIAADSALRGGPWGGAATL